MVVHQYEVPHGTSYLTSRKARPIKILLYLAADFDNITHFTRILKSNVRVFSSTET